MGWPTAEEGFGAFRLMTDIADDFGAGPPAVGSLAFSHGVLCAVGPRRPAMPYPTLPVGWTRSQGRSRGFRVQDGEWSCHLAP